MERRRIVETRLVLGFDAGCTACSGLARQIEEKVGDKLEVVSLLDPEMGHWRKQALGENAPWAPTLVEVKSGKVRAWTGLSMGVALSRKLGPKSTWQVMQALGDVGPAPETGIGSAAASGLSRSQFLKGLGGAVVGMSVLSGTGGLTASATAAEDGHWLAQLSISSSKELSGKQAAVAWVRLTRGRHVRRVLSTRSMGANPAARRIRSGLLSTTRAGVESPSIANFKGVSHNLKGGGRLLALSYQEDNALMVSYRLDKPGQKTRILSKVIEPESEEVARVLVASEDDKVFEAPRGATRQGRSCTRSSQCGGFCVECLCASFDTRCAINCCGPCAFTCSRSTVVRCLGCVGVWCPFCIGLNRCCRRKECRINNGCN